MRALLAAVLALPAPILADGTCRYDYTVWSATERRTSRTVHVDKPRSQLRADERGPLGCTPCREDQEAFDALWRYARRHAAPSAMASRPMPLEAFLMAMLVGMQRRMMDMESEAGRRGGSAAG